MKTTEKHYVEITPEKGKHTLRCSCSWSGKENSRDEAYSSAHAHIADAYKVALNG